MRDKLKNFPEGYSALSRTFLEVAVTSFED